MFAGLTRFATVGHLARAVLEATAYQTRDVLEAMEADSGVNLTELKVDGGMVGNALLMQFQADILGVPVVIPEVTETTVVGAAYAAGLATGYWSDPDDLRSHWAEQHRYTPSMDAETRATYYDSWKKAVEKSFDWARLPVWPHGPYASTQAKHERSLARSCLPDRRGSSASR